MVLLAGMSVWRHQHEQIAWNFEVLVSNSGYTPELITKKNYFCSLIKKYIVHTKQSGGSPIDPKSMHDKF